MHEHANTFGSMLRRITAADLMQQCDGAVNARTPIKDVFNSIERDDPRKQLQKRPRITPFMSVPQSSGPKALTLVNEGGQIVGCTDHVSIAQLYLRQTMQDLESVLDEQWNEPIGELMWPVDVFPSVPHDYPALDAALDLGRHEAKLILVMREGRIEGFITFSCLLHPTFTLPLFGLILEIEQEALSYVGGGRAAAALRSLSPGRRKKPLIHAHDHFNKLAKQMAEGECPNYSVPLEHSLNGWLFPDEQQEEMEAQMEEWGVPAMLAIEYTTFIDKGTILRKLGLKPEGQSSKDYDRFWRTSEAVRNSIAHGRPWWDILTTPSDLEGFIAQANELLHWLRVRKS